MHVTVGGANIRFKDPIAELLEVTGFFMKDFFIMVAKTITAISVVAVIWLWGYQVGGDKSAQLIEVLKEQRGD